MAEEWWRGAVIYQVTPRSFQDSDGDGVGDLAGIVQRLPYVASLGVDAVWVCPFYRSPMADFGYDVQDYRAVDPLFGTMADFDRLLAGAHGLGLKVLVDMVWSHTSDRHGWFQESRASRDNSKADWYVWADPRPDGMPPNNWLSVFGGSAWAWEPRRRQYYLHHFLSSQPALNWHEAAVAEAVLAAGRFWLDKGVDGFRLDAIDFLMHDELLRDNPARPLSEVPAKLFGMQEHVHDMVRAEALPMLERIRALMDAYPGTTTIGELSSVGDPIERAGTYTAAGDRLHKAYSLGLMRRPFTAAALREVLAETGPKLGDGWMCWAFSNHDMERAVTRWGDGSAAAARMMLALLVSLRGTPCLYQGEELGLPEAELPFEALRDPYGITFWPDYKGRDGSRTPMPWTPDGPGAGFTVGTPWLPVPDDHRPLAVSEQERDPDSPLNTLRRLLGWRRQRPELRIGGLELVEMGERVLAFERRAAGARLLCLFNPSPDPLRLPLPGPVAEGVGWRVEGGDLVFPGWGAAFIPL